MTLTAQLGMGLAFLGLCLGMAAAALHGGLIECLTAGSAGCTALSAVCGYSVKTNK